MSLSSFFAQFGAWNWLIVALVLFGLETVMPGVYCVWFGVAAVLVGFMALGVDLAWQWQLIVFALLSVTSVFVARRLARADAAPSDTPDLNVRAAQYIGRVVTVEEAIRDGRGRVRVGDTVWQAEGKDASAGTRVKIVGVRNTVFLVDQE